MQSSVMHFSSIIIAVDVRSTLFNLKSNGKHKWDSQNLDLLSWLPDFPHSFCQLRTMWIFQTICSQLKKYWTWTLHGACSCYDKVFLGIASVQAYLNIFQPFSWLIAAWMLVPRTIKHIFWKNLYNSLVFFYVFRRIFCLYSQGGYAH